MIVTFVEFRLQAPLSEAAATQLFETSAPNYRNLPGLVRKHYVLSEDRQVAGGLYFWQDSAAAERAYDVEWHRRVRALYGAEPQIAWFNSPVAVDNERERR
jgi:Putative mono-oxygenase ydhR